MSYVYAFAGGKGGIGKSFLTANIGRLLAGTGKSVLLADLDLGGANLHSFLGIAHTARGLNHFLNNAVRDPAEAAVPCSIPGLWLLSSENCGLEIANLPYARKQKIMTAFKKLPHDYILLDIGAGTSFNTLDFILAANEIVFIFTEEPPAIENGLGLIKSLYLRQARQTLKKTALANLVEESCRHDTRESFFSIIDRLAEKTDGTGTDLRRILGRMKFRILVNQTRHRNLPAIGHTLHRLFQRHFLSGFDVLGTIAYDPIVHETIVNRRIFVDRFPGHQITTDLTAIVNRLIFPSAFPETPAPKTFSEKTHYEILDLSPRSVAGDIRRAHTDIKALYTENRAVSDAFFTPPEQNAILKKIDTAFNVLGNPARKADYDRCRAGQQPLLPAENETSTEKSKNRVDPPGFVIKADGHKELRDRIRHQLDDQAARELAEAMKYREAITGKDLKAYRQACRIEVSTIFELTRVAADMIRNIEEDNFDALPPLIYLKTFLKDYAGLLGLSAPAVISGYLRHLRENVTR